MVFRERQLEEKENVQQPREVVLQTKKTEVAKKEEENIISKVTGFKKQIYEHSPKENVELIKEFLEKYKGTLKWLIPVVSIYGAYRVLNAKDAKLNVSNLNQNCKKELGFEFDILKDKKVLQELIAFGGVVSAKASVYVEMAKLFIASKLNIDLDDEAQAKKFKTFALLAAIIGLCAFLYGKGVFNMNEDESFMEKNPQLKAFIEQAKEIMEKLLPTAFSVVTTYMVTKHIIDDKEENGSLEEDKENAVETDFTEVKEETAEENEK